MIVTLASIQIGVCLSLSVSSIPKRENTRRLSRSATLDGGSVITDSGYSDSDRTYEFEINNVSQTVSAALWNFFKTESLINMTCPEGFFTGYIERMSIEGESVSISFMVYESIVNQ